MNCCDPENHVFVTTTSRLVARFTGRQVPVGEADVRLCVICGGVAVKPSLAPDAVQKIKVMVESGTKEERFT